MENIHHTKNIVIFLDLELEPLEFNSLGKENQGDLLSLNQQYAGLLDTRKTFLNPIQLLDHVYKDLLMKSLNLNTYFKRKVFDDIYFKLYIIFVNLGTIMFMGRTEIF